MCNRNKQLETLFEQTALDIFKNLITLLTIHDGSGHELGMLASLGLLKRLVEHRLSLLDIDSVFDGGRSGQEAGKDLKTCLNLGQILLTSYF